MEKMNKLPTKPVLEETVILVLKGTKSTLTTQEVNKRVADILDIPKELLELEGSQGTGTEYSYRMCWIRSDLKKKGLIDNPSRGTWKYIIPDNSYGAEDFNTIRPISSTALTDSVRFSKNDIVNILPEYCSETEDKILFRIIDCDEKEKRAVITPVKKQGKTTSVEYVEFDMIQKADLNQR